MSALYIAVIYYLILFAPSFIGSFASITLHIPLLFFKRSRKTGIILITVLLSASLVLDAVSPSSGIEKSEITEIGAVATEDGNIKKNGRYGFPANLLYGSDGWGDYTSLSGDVYIYSNRNTIRKGDEIRCSGTFLDSSFFFAESIMVRKEGMLRGFRNKAEGALRERLSNLGEGERDLSLMLLLAMTDSGEGKIAGLSRSKGVSHVFALSGMHLSIISSFLIPPLTLLFRKKRRAEIFVIIPLFIFTFLSGLRASLLRALLFRILFTLFKDESADELFLLTFILHASIFPESLIRAGAVFSYLSVAGLLSIEKLLEGVCKRVIKLRLSFLWTSVSCLVLTIPYSLYLFSSYSISGILYSPIVNFLVSLYMAFLLLYLIFPFFSIPLSWVYEAIMYVLNLPYFSYGKDDLMMYAIMLSFVIFILSLSLILFISDNKKMARN